MIEVTSEAGITTLTIDRPEKANALTREMLIALDKAVAEAQSAVLVLTGRGKVFSAGADLDEARAGLAKDWIWEQLSGRIAAFPGLTIAALNGTVAGGAMGMVLACDLRVAVPGTNFFYPVMKLGFLPQPSDPGRLIALIGPSRAKRILLAGEEIDTVAAEAWGLIDRIAEPDQLEATIEAWSALATAAPPKILSDIKALMT